MADRTCRECREIISAFVDGEASREDDALLRQHLASCPECRATLDAYRDISGAVRGLPAIHPPHHLTDAIFAQTIDAEPRRLFLITSRLGYSLAAIASLLLIFVVAGYLIIGGYERSIDPAVASSAPEQSPTAEEKVVWPLHLPIEIKFNKEMNHESVIAALGMQPAREKERLSQQWDGNTLVIGGNPTFKPNTEYEIKISTDATDKWGNRLKEPFQLAFITSSSQTTVQTPTPVLVPTETVGPVPPTATVGQTPPPSANTPESTVLAPIQSTASVTVAPSDPTTVSPVDPDEPVAPTGTATPMPTEPPAEPTSTVEPTVTPTPTPSATSTPVPPPPAPTATSPAPPTVTPTPDAIAVVGAIGDVYWRDQTVQDRLGAPLLDAFTFNTDQLDFQHGIMMLDENGTSIYVLKSGAGWETWAVPTDEAGPSAPGPEPDIYVPGLTFGALWQSDQALQEDMGFALSEFAISFPATVQMFENGRMIATPTTVYVIYDDFTWDWFTYSASS